MKQGLFEITDHRPVARNIFRICLQGDASGITRPGQFVNLQIEGFFLRRPISVFDWNNHSLTLIYKAVGKGTELMSRMKPGEKLDILTGLGNGYNLSLSGEQPLLIGGGVGIPPLYGLAKALKKENKTVTAVLGFNTAPELYAVEDFRALGCDVIVATVDGSCGRKGFVTDVLPESCSYYYACGPLPMLRSVFRTCSSSGEFSLEERMGCGFGACMGCSIQTREGAKRVCREGPVFRKEELLWDA